MEKKLIINFDEYLETVEKLAIEVNKEFKPTVLVGIMRGAAPIIDILSRIFKLPTAYIVIQSYSGRGLEDKQGDFIFSIKIPILKQNILKAYKISKRFDDDISSVCGSFNLEIDKNYIKKVRIAFGGMSEIPKRALKTEKILVNSKFSQ